MVERYTRRGTRWICPGDSPCQEIPARADYLSINEGGIVMDLVAPVAAIPHWTLLYAGLNALLTLNLAIRASQQRIKGNVIFGDGGYAPLTLAIRAHANNIEYVPLTLVLIGFLEIAGQPFWLIHALGATLFVGRALHAVGLSRTGESTPPRFYGILLTWITLLVAAGWSIAAAFIG